MRKKLDLRKTTGLKNSLPVKKKSMGMEEFNGFTLIELLVVIAIIAILAAILFPVFALQPRLHQYKNPLHLYQL